MRSHTSAPTRHGVLLSTTAAAALICSSSAFATESRGYVVGWFHTATFAAPDNCPSGRNPGTFEYREQELAALGYKPEEVRKMLDENNDQQLRKLLVLRGRGPDGKPVHIYNAPTSVPDPKIKLVEGKVAYGFNLDGRTDSDDFEDPETHENGVDNGLWRAVGCFKDYDFSLPTRPFYEQAMWDAMIDTMPAWSIIITGEDLSKDGPVTVTFGKTLRHLKRNAVGGALFNVSYVIDPNPRSHNVFQGAIKDGVLSIEPSRLRLEGESPFLTEVNLNRTQMRLKLEPNGELKGYIGGYQNWHEFYFMYSSYGGDCLLPDRPGLYYALQRLADADPDPATGKNTSLSATYRLEAVPAYLATLDGKIVATPISVTE